MKAKAITWTAWNESVIPVTRTSRSMRQAVAEARDLVQNRFCGWGWIEYAYADDPDKTIRSEELTRERGRWMRLCC